MSYDYLNSFPFVFDYLFYYFYPAWRFRLIKIILGSRPFILIKYFSQYLDYSLDLSKCLYFTSDAVISKSTTTPGGSFILQIIFIVCPVLHSNYSFADVKYCFGFLWRLYAIISGFGNSCFVVLLFSMMCHFFLSFCQFVQTKDCIQLLKLEAALYVFFSFINQCAMYKSFQCFLYNPCSLSSYPLSINLFFVVCCSNYSTNLLLLLFHQ